MTNKLSFFNPTILFNTRIIAFNQSAIAASIFCNIGDWFLTPVRCLFDGRIVEVVHNENSLVYSTNEYSDRAELSSVSQSKRNLIRIAIAVALLIPGLLLGSFFKVISYLSHSTRENHKLADAHFKSIEGLSYPSHKNKVTLTPIKKETRAPYEVTIVLEDKTPRSVLPEKVQLPPFTPNNEQQLLIQNWLSTWKDDFVAHAIWNGNFSSVVKDKAILPAEAILRTKGSVEREKGTYGNRVIETLPSLTSEDIAALETLDPENESDLQKLLKEQSENPFSVAEKEKLNELQIKIVTKAKELYFGKDKFDSVPSDDQIEYHIFKIKIFKKLKIDIKNCLSDEDFSLYTVLDEKSDRDKKIKHIQQKKHGIRNHNIDINFKRNEIINQLSIKYNSRSHLIQIAYDNQKGGVIARLYAKKLQKHKKKALDIKTFKNLRNKIYQLYNLGLSINGTTLISEVRTLQNNILWSYGNIAVLRGGGKNIGMDLKGEFGLLHPIDNNGDFFTLALKNPDTLIIGGYQDLYPFSKELDAIEAKYVYIESLTEEQKLFFNIPR